MQGATSGTGSNEPNGLPEVVPPLLAEISHKVQALRQTVFEEVKRSPSSTRNLADTIPST